MIFASLRATLTPERLLDGRSIVSGFGDADARHAFQG